MLMFTRALKKNRSSCCEMTLLELLLAVIILTPLLVIAMKNFFTCAELGAKSYQVALATHAVGDRLAAIRNTDFASILSTYNGTTFTVAGLTGIGMTSVVVDPDDPNMLTVSIEFSWKDHTGLVIGGDKDLDGVLDATEVNNGYGIPDSPVSVTTQIYKT